MEPAVIKKLDAAVVNRIAAGEIIQRPANALKELIENSLDAKSTVLQITVKAGGLKLLQISDNGTGIRREDLEIVCERFTTSKLSKFEDLTQIATYGFRGEALASISHVAHLSIQTKTAQERCGYKASYTDGRQTAPPKPCAVNQGTTITIEDLFYTMPQRKQALKSPAEEFQRISDVVGKYAVHNAGVAFTLKKFGEQTNALRTIAAATQQENIAAVFGAQIAKDLMSLDWEDAVHKAKMRALVTRVSYAGKKAMLLLFINHRLVESAAMKAAIDSVYCAYLPKGMHPFVYMSLELEPTNVDVNVHPTKHEVHFLYEDEIIEKIKQRLESQLLGSNAARTFYKQLKLPGVEESSEGRNKDNSPLGETQRLQAKNMIRTDAKEQKLEKFLYAAGCKPLEKSDSAGSHTSMLSGSSLTDAGADESFRAVAARKSKEVSLTSVLNMQRRVEHGCSVPLRKALKELVFVGVVDRTFALFQHETKLYLCNTLKFSAELFYQRLVYDFQNLPMIKVSPPLSVKELVLIALNSTESGWTPADGDKVELADTAAAILVQKAAIMREYFSLRITAAGELESLPALLPKHVPSTIYLPVYLLRLATDVEWESEEECFECFCRETARYYALTPAIHIQAHPKQHKWFVEHVLYPAFKQYLLPPERLKQQLYELASLPKLYKVFERC